jgi:catechol 2,3-dioxygenase-like lactoylglutathione lyase family enzyme
MPMEPAAEPGPHVIGIDHVQVAIPAGGEHVARRFYADVLGLREVPKPPALANRGGCWFASPDGSVHVHLGVDPDFRPATRAHPAFLVEDVAAARRRLRDVGAEIVEDGSIAGVHRCYTADPFGNRLELIAAADGGFTTRDAKGPGQRS